MRKTNTTAILLVILGSSLVLFDVSLYTSYVEMLGFVVLVLGFSLLSMDNRKYIIVSSVMCVGLFIASLAVDYAFTQIAPDGLVVSFREYLSNSLNYLTFLALVLSFAAPIMFHRARASGKAI